MSIFFRANIWNNMFTLFGKCKIISFLYSSEIQSHHELRIMKPSPYSFLYTTFARIYFSNNMRIRYNLKKIDLIICENALMIAI